MKKLLFMALALLVLGSQTQAVAADKKDKKEKKGLKWEWDGETLSGNDEIDTYIKTIDTLYNKVNSYKDSIDLYEFHSKQFTLDNGKKYEICYMLDDKGQLVTRGTVNWQCVRAIMQGTNIVLDMTNAGLKSANAALTLPKLGMKALKFSKYVKGGPAVISAGTKAIKDVRKKWIRNSQRWKEVKNDAIPNAKSLNIPGMNDDLAAKLDKCCYIKLVPEIAENTQVAKNEGDIVESADAKTTFDDLNQRQMAAEKEGQAAENMEGADEFMKGDPDDLD
jgi:hypothetical protein